MAKARATVAAEHLALRSSLKGEERKKSAKEVGEAEEGRRRRGKRMEEAAVETSHPPYRWAMESSPFPQRRQGGTCSRVRWSTWRRRRVVGRALERRERKKAERKGGRERMERRLVEIVQMGELGKGTCFSILVFHLSMAVGRKKPLTMA
jgi:hypothetical protein